MSMRLVGKACRILLVALVAACSLGVGSSAFAQAKLAGGGMDLHMFRPAVDSKGFISLNGTDILGAGDVSFGLVLDAGFGLMPLNGFVLDTKERAENAESNDRLVDSFFTGTLQANYGIANLLVVGIDIPIQVVGGQNTQIPGVYNLASDGLEYQGIGNLGIHGKVRMLRVEREGVGLAAVLHAELPTGDSKQFAGEPGVGLWPMLAFEYRPIREIRLGVNAGYRFNSGKGAQNVPVDGTVVPDDPNNPSAAGACLPSTDPSLGTFAATATCLQDPGTLLDYDDLITFGLGASFRVAPAWDIVLEGYGTQVITGFNKAGLSLEALGGIKIFVER
ncbi:MAG: hypothetical protein KC417_02900, partial [Myxococcales bacterium]|nr:hypothetical protein [Myxococcales bacterium]